MKKKRSRKADLAKREEILRKRRKRKRRRILVLVIEVIILAALSVVAYGIFKLGSLNHLSLNVDNNGWTQEGYTNIALWNRQPGRSG